MDDEDDIIEIWEISDKRLSWSPFESAFIEEKEKTNEELMKFITTYNKFGFR